MRFVVAMVIILIIGVLAVSLYSKVRTRAHLREFANAVAELRIVPVGWAGSVAAMAVAAEAVVLVLLAWPRSSVLGLAAATLLFGGFAIALSIALRRGTRVGCHCFGASNTPVSGRHVARSGALCVVALGALCCAFFLPDDPLTGLNPPTALVAVTGSGVIVSVLVWLDDVAWLFRGTPASGRAYVASSHR